MSSLHHAIRAYAAQGDPPTVILSKLSGLLHVSTGGQFATVLCGAVDVARRQVTIANAGHLPPLLVTSESSQFVDTDVGAPIGVTSESDYGQVTFPVPPQATLLAFTDGLVERQGREPRRRACNGSASLPAATTAHLITCSRRSWTK